MFKCFEANICSKNCAKRCWYFSTVTQNPRNRTFSRRNLLICGLAGQINHYKRTLQKSTKMVSFLHVVLIFATFAVLPLKAQDNQEIAKLETFYYDKCLKNSKSPEAFSKLRNDVYEMYKYFEYAFQFLPNQRETFCKNERSNLVHRLKEIENDLKACLVYQERFFAKFVKESFEEALHFLCHNNGEYTTRFFSSQAADCRKKMEEANSNDLENCLNRMFAPTKSYITQKEICDDITVTRKCFSRFLQVYCPTSHDYKKLNEAFFDYIGKPCGSCIHFVSSFVLVGSVLLHYFVNKM